MSKIFNIGYSGSHLVGTSNMPTVKVLEAEPAKLPPEGNPSEWAEALPGVDAP